MPIKLGSGGISKLYVGSTAITRAYVGETMVFDSAPVEPFVVLDPYWSPTNATSYTAVGNITGPGLVVIALGFWGSGAATIDSVVAAGVSATQRVHRTESSTASSAIYTAEATGPGDIVVNLPSTAFNMNIQAFLVQGFNPVPHDTASNGHTSNSAVSLNIDVEAGGFIVGAYAFQRSQGNTIGASIAHRQFASAAAGHTVSRGQGPGGAWTGLDEDTNENEGQSNISYLNSLVAASFSPA